MINTEDNDNVASPPAIGQCVDLAFRMTAIAICLAALDSIRTSLKHPDMTLALLVFLVTLYLLFTTLLTYRKQKADPGNKLRIRLAYLDSFLLGVTVILLPNSIVTAVAIVLVVAIRAIANGGLGLLFGHLSLLASGAVLAFGALQPSITVNTQETVSLITIVSVPLFTAYVAWRMYVRQKELAAAVQELNVNNVQLKLNNYKLAKYLSPSLRKAIVSGKRVTLETQRKNLTVFFSDIRGFSELSEELEAETLTSILNLYLTEMSEIALKFGGTVDKFIGDGIMVFFGDPVTKGAKEDCIACVSMAIAMQKRMNDLNKRWASQGIRNPLQVRMGINTGFCTVGNFGTENRLDYTLLGMQVNKASRLESAANAGQILISRQTYELVKDIVYCESRGPVSLKGFKEPIEAFSVVDLRASLNKKPQHIEHSTDGFTMTMDLETIPHMQKHRIMVTLEEAYERLRKDIDVNTKEDVKIFK